MFRISAFNARISVRTFHNTRTRFAGSLFGEITKKEEVQVQKSETTKETTVENDVELAKYHRDEAESRQIRTDKYVTPLKQKLFALNVEKNGFFKNHELVTDSNSTYRLSLTPQEIDILEPSIYIQLHRIKLSLKKATQVNRFVRGFNVKTAINQLHFNPKKMSTELEILLKRGLVQARQENWDEDKAYIDSVWVGSDGQWRKRPDFKGRGRGGILEHPYVHVKAILKSHQTTLRKQWEKQQKEKESKPRMFLNNEPLNFKVRALYKW